MNTTSRSIRVSARPSMRGFTLLELLVVIVIIGVLAGLAFAGAGAVMRLVKKQQARNDANQVVLALNAYFTDYGRYPLEDHGEDVEMLSDPQIMNVLMGDDEQLNPRGITYFEGKEAKDGRAGLVMSGDQPGKLVDPWGEEYVIVIDGNYDKEVENPDPNAERPTIRKGVIVYSKGEDRDENSAASGGDIWKDNVKSWE